MSVIFAHNSKETGEAVMNSLPTTGHEKALFSTSTNECYILTIIISWANEPTVKKITPQIGYLKVGIDDDEDDEENTGVGRVNFIAKVGQVNTNIGKFEVTFNVTDETQGSFKLCNNWVFSDIAIQEVKSPVFYRENVRYNEERCRYVLLEL
ncbi:unnamed protein product [Didymodactylos carnosus]|uniref:Uncharacterized protein n=1 Tax=Didymodactylos carnosus TaxID=1234261 RepID=A0A815F6E4_9BILA|nr:unnamed protein product [Didymodactylos carnosus]CAF1321796.1 unnamed protein product [Didymodactylos carnosus]CAF3748366.1 unnamed protein product [Didymodactylos carnosus]CAF4168177.1 unnamed protein product [Didymodactylos carnosus]